MRNAPAGKEKKSSQMASSADTAGEVAELRRQLALAKEANLLLQSESRQMLQHAGHGIRVINKDSTVRYINQSFAEMSGINPAEAIGKKCWEVFPGPFCHTHNCRMARVLNGETMVQVEIDRTKRDGTIIPCIVNAVPLYSDTGAVIGIIETFTDITERRLLQSQVEESEERYRSLIELGTEAGEAIVMLQDIDGREGIQTFVSDQWPRITGYTKKELLGTCFFNIISDRDKVTSIARHRQKMSGKAVPGIFEMNIIRKDKKEVTIELTGAFTSYQGKCANVVYLRDVTQRKILENRLDMERNRYLTLFEDVPVAIWEVDYSETKKKIEKLRAKGVQDLRKYLLSHQEEFEEYFYCQKVLGVNKACTILWEADSIKELFDGLYPLLKKRPVGWARDIENIVLFSEGQTRVNYDSTEPTLKGNIKNVHIEYCIAPGYENTWGRVFSSFFDITDRKKAEAELQKYQDNLQDIIDERTAQLRMEIEQRKQVENMLQNQIQQRADFIRLLVHEFKTPITNILTSSEILQSGIDETKANFLNNIYQGAVSLNRRVDDMFDIARGEIGMLKCQFDFIDPLPMLFEIVRQMTPNAERKGQSIIVDAPASLPLIYGDIDRLQQVIINLLDNALKFNRRHGNIEIKAGVTGSEFLFSIHDEGEGIPLNEQENLFQPYHRLKRSEDGPEGLGLGLALAKKIVELHRGQIFVSSEKGRGTTFSFKLPLDNDLKAKGPM